MEIHRTQNNQKNLVKVARIILSEFKAYYKAKVIETAGSKRIDTEINGIEFRVRKWTFTANWFLKGVLRQFNGERIIYSLGLFSFLLHHVACGILVSQSAMEPTLLCCKQRVLTVGPSIREVPRIIFSTNGDRPSEYTHAKGWNWTPSLHYTD